MAAVVTMAGCAPAMQDMCGDGTRDRDGDLAVLAGSRAEFHGCLTVLRRFHLEHTFRLFKHILGLTRAQIRAPEAADRCSDFRADRGVPGAFACRRRRPCRAPLASGRG
jgi:hypothetical protein